MAFEIHYFALPTPTGKRAQTRAGLHVLVLSCLYLCVAAVGLSFWVP